ncbi:MAG: hypothetical protein J7L11_07575 [Thermoprotei archaeon]|nr:hypothetical protein [Thermoprotei archaeon]
MTRLTFGPDVKSLLKKLILGYREYFYNDILNSEGRKVFAELARMLVYEHPELKSVVRRVRRDPTLENVLRIARLVLGEEVTEELFSSVIQGPFIYKLGYMKWDAI